MKNKLVATIISGAREYKAVSIEDLKGLSVPEQFELHPLEILRGHCFEFLVPESHLFTGNHSVNK